MKVFLASLCLGVAVLALLIGGPAAAQEAWRATLMEDHLQLDRSRSVFPRRASTPRGQVMLPDGLVVTHDGDIESAWYGGPTTRYEHGVLGDAIEASSLHVTLRDGDRLSLELPQTDVFEDRYPRLADLDGDGTTEIVTIRSSVTAGASVTVYGVRDGRLVERATTGFIGIPDRWLNIAGIASFRGKAGKEIAFVRTPHIGGTLFLVELTDSGLKQLAALDGFSNHVIGSRELRLSAAADIDGDGVPELALPSDDRRTLRIVGLRNGALVDIAAAGLPAPIDKAITAEDAEGGVSFVVGLDNGKYYRVHR